jgi:DNA invertase Pin-like site-specific DNA recombinase
MTEVWLDTSKDNPISEVVMALMSWVAAEERRKISERTKLGIQRRKNLGIWKGGRPRKRVAPVSQVDT